MDNRLEVVGRNIAMTTRAARGAQPDTLSSLQRQLGEKFRFDRDREIYAEGSRSKYWFEVISGSVRLVMLLADGRRHIGNFCLAGDWFGLDVGILRRFSAEAVEDTVVYRYPRQSIGRLITELPQVAQQLWNLTLRDLAHARGQTAMLGRMTAPMRVSSFLLHLSKRQGGGTLIELPMSRADVADYLGLTIETVCRVLSRLVGLRLIAIPSVNTIELIDSYALETIYLEGFDPGLGPYYGRRRTRSGRQEPTVDHVTEVPNWPKDAFKNRAAVCLQRRSIS
jgi:CRP/FNR family transcriptional regulator, nitrogen fixation regulation protein